MPQIPLKYCCPGCPQADRLLHTLKSLFTTAEPLHLRQFRSCWIIRQMVIEVDVLELWNWGGTLVAGGSSSAVLDMDWLQEYKVFKIC